jgi:hypothetical protein
MWLKKANAWIDDLSEISNIQKVSAHHDGYDRFGVVHRRDLQFSESEWQLDVIDILQCGDEQKKFAEIYYHFAPEVDIKPGSVEHCWTATWQGRQKRLVIYTDPCWSYEVVKGSTNPITGVVFSGARRKSPV